ncbi:hypothetical protein BH23PLA1_BH23PLA1_37940 [soil metagenome]
MGKPRTVHATQPADVRVGHILAFTSYVVVAAVHAEGRELVVRDLDGDHSEIRIKGASLIERAASADQHHKVERVSRTRAAEVLIGSAQRPLTVAFVKQDGQERILRGRLVRPEPLLGRSLVEALDEAESDRLRLVDHRTLAWLIVDGIKYQVARRTS